MKTTTTFINGMSVNYSKVSEYLNKRDLSLKKNFSKSWKYMGRCTVAVGVPSM